LDYYTDPSVSVYGETLSVLLIGYLALLSLGLWWLLRKIVDEISERVDSTLEPAPVSRRLIAVWAVACVAVIIPIGATLSPAWKEIRTLILGG